MNTGLTKSRIQTEIWQALLGETRIEAVFGFGSFFRDEPFNDIDLALVFTEDCDDPLQVYERLLARLKVAHSSLGVRFDVTPLTFKEFREQPLRDHALLVPLFRRAKC
jgi:predicted nucleotidyltransferase